ncbi:MAG: hypothetical protein JWO03_2374 [Bacteroidetes bacterium]|nr:hypothetical protein [Bacteroidota bacterium]
MALSLMAKAQAQQPDTTFRKRIVSKTQIEAVVATYVQDGNNSAVTGGIGTEALVVIGPNLKIRHQFRKYNTFVYHGGADFITSASTDNIDHIRSSPSRKDTRGFSDLSYRRDLKKIDMGISGGLGFSVESDYFSVPVSLSLEYREPKRMRTYNLSFQAIFDDLRWGRLNPDYLRPVELIYPSELRYQNWFTEYKRNSYNIKIAFTQVINTRMVASLMPEFSYQTGLLSTPFHRVYFTDGSEKVENLPMQRIKVPIAARLNYFAGKRTILKGQYSFYWDNFGIVSHGIELECAIKVKPVFTISPFFRFYYQAGARYFRPYMAHDPGESFYTSDYDLSTMETYKAGLSFKYAPFSYAGKRFQFEEMMLRYAYYRQSNGLWAHIVSLVIDIAAYGKQK